MKKERPTNRGFFEFCFEISGHDIVIDKKFIPKYQAYWSGLTYEDLKKSEVFELKLRKK